MQHQTPNWEPLHLAVMNRQQPHQQKVFALAVREEMNLVLRRHGYRELSLKLYAITLTTFPPHSL